MSRGVRTPPPRKRSNALRLSLLGAAVAVPAVALLWPARESGVVLTSAADCRQPLRITQAQCVGAYQASLQQHGRLAPRYVSRADCDADFGACGAEPAGTYWSPPQRGFLVGYTPRADDEGAPDAGARPAQFHGSLPLYQQRDGDFVNPHGRHLRNGTGFVHGANGSITPPARPVTLARAGFGSRGGAFGG